MWLIIIVILVNNNNNNEEENPVFIYLQYCLNSNRIFIKKKAIAVYPSWAQEIIFIFHL